MNTVLKDLYDELVELNNFTHTIHITDILRSIGHLYLEKERQQIIDAVDNTIDAYRYYTESPHNPPPMNGSDYYNQTFNPPPQ